MFKFMNNRIPVWQVYTDYIPVLDDFGKVTGFKRYKTHRFDENKTKVVFYDENKKFFVERRSPLDTRDIKVKYAQFVM